MFGETEEGNANWFREVGLGSGIARNPESSHDEYQRSEDHDGGSDLLGEFDAVVEVLALQSERQLVACADGRREGNLASLGADHWTGREMLCHECNLMREKEKSPAMDVECVDDECDAPCK
jgi:hypothetical protein